jgi:hypothetical protein
VFLDTLNGVLNITSAQTGAGDPFNSLAYPGLGSGVDNGNIVDFFVIYYSNYTNRIEAIECALRFYSQTYNSVVNKGQTTTKVTSTWDQISVPGNGSLLVEGGPVQFEINLVSWMSPLK